jgi:CHAT domain-containing protein
MKTRSVAIFLALLPFTPFLFSQTVCDPAKASDILTRARETWFGERFSEAPGLALSALPWLENCADEKARSADIFLQAAVWQTEIEAFGEAAANLQKALDLAGNEAQKVRVLSAWVDLDLASRQYGEARLRLPAARAFAPAGPAAWRLSLQEAELLTATGRGQEALVLLEELKSQLGPEADGMEPDLRLRAYAAQIAAMAASAQYAAVNELGEVSLVYAAKVKPEHAGARIRLLLLLAESANSGSSFRKKVPAYLDTVSALLAGAPAFVGERWNPAVTVEQIRMYSFQLQHPKSLAMFEKALGQLVKARLSHRLLEAQAYQYVAHPYLTMGLNEKALEASRASNAVLSQLPNPSPRMVAFNNARIGQCYQSMGEIDLAVEYLEKGAAVLTKDVSPEGQLPFIVQLINVYGQKKDTLNTRRLIERYEAALLAASHASAQDHFLLGKYWFNYHKDFGSLDRGIAYAEAALRDYGPKVSNFYSKELELRLSHAYLRQRDFTKSFELASQLAGYFEQRRAKLGQAYGTEHYSWMLAVSALSAWRLYESTGDTSARRLAYEQCEKSENALYHLRRQKKDNPDVPWITDAHLYAGLVNLRYHFYAETGDHSHVQKAFDVGEMSRMARFQEYLNTAQALQFGDLSPEAARQERFMLAEIARIKTGQDKLYFQSGPGKDSAENALAGQLTELQRRYNLLLASFEVQYPSYHRLKYDRSHLDLRTVQRQVLQPDETLLGYYYYFDEIAILAVRSDSVVFRQVRVANRDFDGIDSLIAWLAHFPLVQKLPETQFADRQSGLARELYRAYETLVAPVASFLSRDVLIQPCDILVYLPFEALLSRPPDQLARPASWPYLANDKNIAYLQTATIFDAVQRRKPVPEPPTALCAFAPFFDGDTASFAGLDPARRIKGDYYSPLPHTGEEAVSVAKLLRGEAFVGKAASAGKFGEKVRECRILHAATHASGGNGNLEPSFLALQAGPGTAKTSLLFADQIYQLPINADLVTLSACESGLGGYSENEGLEGLTRAFTCAGARNIVASLWSVNDASTKSLMILFYREIKKGLPYNRALANAKRTFVRENRQYAHPYYWAGFVLNGR